MCKICDGCGIEKELSKFSPNKKSKGGFRNRCKQCVNQAAARYRNENRTRIRECQSRFRDKNRDKLREKYAVWRRNRKEPGANARYSREYQKRNRLACNLRKRLRQAVKGRTKAGSAIRDLGCSVEELKRHLEKQFQSGMSWSNYGDWEIDHIIPLSAVDLSDREQLKKVVHYTNLQPLWKSDNCSKGSKVPEISGTIGGQHG